jgi:hypothetical protein
VLREGQMTMNRLVPGGTYKLHAAVSTYDRPVPSRFVPTRVSLEIGAVIIVVDEPFRTGRHAFYPILSAGMLYWLMIDNLRLSPVMARRQFEKLSG